MSKMKTCSKCGKRKLATTEYFNRDRYRKSGLTCQCRACRKAHCQKPEVKERVRERNRRYRKMPRGYEFGRKANEQWRKRNREGERERGRQWRDTLRGHLYDVYHNMNSRCNNPKNTGYRNYGGRGIQVKFMSFDDFYDYITTELGITTYEQIKGLQIDRVDNDGYYEKGNIRFCTCKENLNNRRKTQCQM